MDKEDEKAKDRAEDLIDALIEWLRNSAVQAKTDAEWTRELFGDIQSEKPEIKFKTTEDWTDSFRKNWE